MKWLICVGILFLVGCSPTRVAVQPAERIPLNLNHPTPLQLQKVEFVVSHKDNSEAVFSDLEKKKMEPVLFCLTGVDYKALAVNISDIKDYIILQRKVIDLYKEYYEGNK